MRCHVQFVCSEITALLVHIIEIIDVLIAICRDYTVEDDQ